MVLKRPRAVAGPLIIAWDTCTVRGVLAVGAAGRLLLETRFEARKGHATWLMPQLDSMLKDLGLSPSDVDYVAAGVGPGTFTGVKVGVACAKAVAMALERPVAAMSTLDIVARGAPPAADLVLSTTDARRGQLYAAAYRREEGILERATDYLCLEPAGISRALASLAFEELAVAGEAPEVLVSALERRGRVVHGGDPYPAGGDLIALAHSIIARGETTDAISLSPVYLKKPT